MATCGRRLVAVGFAILFGLSTLVSGEQSSVQRETPAGGGALVRSEMSLTGYTVSVAHPPTLNANDAAHRSVVSADGASAPGRVRVAQLETTASIRLGDLAVGKQDRAGVRYDLWLEATADGWQLQVTDSAAAVVGRVPLTRRRGPASPHFIAAVVPQTVDTGRLTMRWGDYEAATDVTFVDPPRLRNAEENRPNVVANYSNRQTEENIRLAQARMLAQRSETALTIANGRRLSVMYQRTFEGDKLTANVRRRGLPANGPAFAGLMSTPAGSLVMLVDAAVPKLKTDVPLRFGQLTLKTGNQVTGFPGTYSMWLKRTANGWRLVFNHAPDVWSSQHNPKSDAGEIELSYSSSSDMPSRPFAAALVPTAADRGRLLIIWGPHEWSADFVVGS